MRNGPQPGKQTDHGGGDGGRRRPPPAAAAAAVATASGGEGRGRGGDGYVHAGFSWPGRRSSPRAATVKATKVRGFGRNNVRKRRRNAHPPFPLDCPSRYGHRIKNEEKWTITNNHKTIQNFGLQKCEQFWIVVCRRFVDLRIRAPEVRTFADRELFTIC